MELFINISEYSEVFTQIHIEAMESTYLRVIPSEEKGIRPFL